MATPVLYDTPPPPPPPPSLLPPPPPPPTTRTCTFEIAVAGLNDVEPTVVNACNPYVFPFDVYV